jgi:23S rRNA (cytidine1920-2'-O)/16S rRNA (cytidine1409-2'-O)-methyltransferase
VSVQGPYVSRGGLKLRHALEVFNLGVSGLACADFGCNVGGFTDCLLAHGAASVIAVDTGYGALAWKLRQDPRVLVRERTSALHAAPPPGGVDLVVIDMGWTPQARCLPAALAWLRPDDDRARIVTLIKPHYELRADEKPLLARGVLPEDHAQRVVDRLVASLPALGTRVLGLTRSPILGGAGKGNASGNAEWLALLARG